MDQPKTIRFVPARFFESFIAVARELIFRPERFFAQLRPSGSLSGPLVFLFLCLFLWSLFFANMYGAKLQLFAALFVFKVVATLLATVCLHAILTSPFFNARLPYEGTLSVVAYAYIVDLVVWVPVLNIFASFYGLVLMYVGFKAIHRLTIRRAAFAVFLAVSLSVFWGMVLGLIAPEWVVNGLMQAVERSSTPA